MRLTAGSRVEFPLLSSSPTHLGFSLLSPTVVLSPLLRHLYQNTTRVQHNINPKKKHGIVINTQGNGVVSAETSLPGLMWEVFTIGSPSQSLGVIGGYSFGRELVMAEVATSVNGVAMEVMDEVALNVCALFIEDPVCARALALALYANGATIPHGGLCRDSDSSIGSWQVRGQQGEAATPGASFSVTFDPSVPVQPPPDLLWTISEKQR